MVDDFAVSLALHTLAIIHWIGGLAFVTLVVLPFARSRPTAKEGLALFDAVEQRFAAQVRFSIPLAGATGFWMTYRMDFWQRFVDARFWWMAAMLALWLVFTAIVFVLEPALRERFDRQARRDPAATLRRVARLHLVLLALATLTALGAVAGAHGFDFF